LGAAIWYSVKTWYIYSVTSKLFNVRLDEKRLRKARRLRESGRKLADVVREAIDTEYGALVKPTAATDPVGVVTAILDRFPDPADLSPRTYDVHDARAARSAIAGALKRRLR
jgi:hypothetical protein